MSTVRNVRYTDDTPITKTRLRDAPRYGQTVSGYGAKIPTGYEIKYEGRWHRVYMMQYGNSGTPYIKHRGEDLVLSLHAKHEIQRMVEGVGAPTPQKGSES